MSKDYPFMQLHELVLPAMTNHHGTLFAGAGMQLMCKAAFMVARDTAQNEMVMAAVHFIQFYSPVPVGSTLELQAHVKRIGNSSMTITVMGFIKRLSQDAVLEGSFELVAVNALGRPVKIYPSQEYEAICSTSRGNL